jgi:fructose-1,6-bisphosphatase/inositol monophosphatase family enzyme
MNWETAGIKCVKEALEKLNGVRATKTFDNSVNPHTDADLVSHNALVLALEKSGLACDLVSEEFNQTIKINGGSDVRVLVDPIDGTLHFTHKELFFCAVGMIVIQNGKPLYSFVGDIATGDVYHADSERAYKNGKSVLIPPRGVGKPIITGWAAGGPRVAEFYAKFTKLPPNEYVMFNFGQMLQAAKMTDGCYDACYEILPAKMQEFAGAIIAWRAGAELSTLEGKPIVWDQNLRQTMLVSRDKELHQKLLNAFNS